MGDHRHYPSYHSSEDHNLLRIQVLVCVGYPQCRHRDQCRTKASTEEQRSKTVDGTVEATSFEDHGRQQRCQQMS